MDLVELNEAFACQVLAVLKGWGWNDPDKLNVNGRCPLGHHWRDGGRILADMLAELHRREGRYALKPCALAVGKALPLFLSVLHSIEVVLLSGEPS